jgi:hypothetical protein
VALAAAEVIDAAVVVVGELEHGVLIAEGEGVALAAKISRSPSGTLEMSANQHPAGANFGCSSDRFGPFRR